ncbi:MAG: hypothetical protein P4L59_15200 [Desulfosporosinus sp.]|nr:hypothetical protein [Desulfosporosinus sp.]
MITEKLQDFLKGSLKPTPITSSLKPSQGYVLFDVLLALFLFSIGFAVLFGLTEGAVSESRQATSLLEGANLAQKKMDQLAVHGWNDNIVRQTCIPGGSVEGNEGRFHWLIVSDWDDVPQLLRVSVEVRWTERGNPTWYKLESLYEVE